jgi:acyl-coenzyme A synthetase/AMP-(fatty) acid ligase
VTAVVRPAPGATPDDALRERLVDRVREALGPHKVPREVRFVASIPETETGKTDRAALFDGSEGR